ncbi:MAG: prenyltransferase/squalene oxidase repeat-containing protein [Myxococcota bacterium]
MHRWPLVLALAGIAAVAVAQEPSAVLTDFGGMAATTAPSGHAPHALGSRGRSLSAEARGARDKGVDWLLKHQHRDGGWASGNWGTTGTEAQSDVATTAFAVLALHRDAAGSGDHAQQLRSGVEFVIQAIETAPEGPKLATPEGTQIQYKLGPLVDTHLASLMLGETLPSLPPSLQPRARRALEKVVQKVQQAQNADGSFDANGWAPVLSTSIAAQSLDSAADLGVRVDRDVLAKSDEYQAGLSKSGGFDTTAGAGVELYAVASTLRNNQATAGRAGPAAPTPEARREAKAAADAAAERVAAAPDAIISGFGSVGGEEMLSYMMISDTLAEKGGKEWTQWESKIGAFLAQAQNADGSWVGHHCITSEAFATAGGVLTLSAGDHAALEG